MKNTLFLYTLSFLIYITSFFNFNTKINNSLYLLNIFTLIGFSILTLIDPYFFYNTHINPFNLNLVSFNIFVFLLHVTPLFLFKNKDNINKNNIVETISNAIIILLIYLFIFHSKLEKIYPLSKYNLIILAIIILLFIYTIYNNKN
jgi:hypothetical protein